MIGEDERTMDIEKGDRYTLECGHEGKVVWVNPDVNVIAVRGVKRSCPFCGKKTMGIFIPTVHIISLEEKRG